MRVRRLSTTTRHLLSKYRGDIYKVMDTYRNYKKRVESDAPSTLGIRMAVVDLEQDMPRLLEMLLTEPHA